MLLALLPPAQEQWDTITVTAEPGPARVLSPSVTAEEEQLLERQPRGAGDTLRFLPGVSVRPNSRGETIARVRGSEERQTQVFLDGAPLSVPWDGRVDISVIPAGLIGAVKVTKGAVPIEYGTNAVAGAVDFETRSGGERNFRAQASAGSFGFADGSVVATLPAGGVDLTLAAAGLTRDAEPVADLSALPFSQPRSDRRVNTDLDTGTLYAAARTTAGPIELRAYVLHVESRKGIAPESDRNPAVDAPRYWRYPDKDLTQVALAGSYRYDGGSAKLVVWKQWFDQRILQFRDVTYASIRAIEDNDDSTQGGRFVLTQELAPVTLRLVGVAQTSRHYQRDTALPAAPGPRLTYRQNSYTLGGEADVALGAGVATVGLGYDRSTNPRTGDKPAQPGKDAVAFSAAYQLPLTDQLSVAVSGGRRNRFPSARELFGDALGRFLPNPDLQPERVWLVDAEIAYATPDLSVTLNPFFQRSDGTIAQRVVRVGGVNRRQRFNLEGSRSYGVDAALFARVAPALDLGLVGTALRARADAGSTPFRRLVQRPSFEVQTALTWRPFAPLSLRGEYRHVGSAVDLAPDGTKARLAAGDELNFRARWDAFTLRGGSHVYLTGSVDNVTDDVITPQLGLPLPGRSFRIGVQIG